jgi:hypothetical protein
MPQIRLYDASTGELAHQGQVDVASTRPFVLFSLLQRLLQSEGLPTRFLFGSPSAGALLRELDVEAEPECDDERARQTAAGRCVDIRFGAAREGEEWAGAEPAGRITLRQALRRFGHRALAFYLMGTHYSQPLGEPIDGLRKASAHVRRLSQTLAWLRSDEPSPPELRHHVRDFFESLATDLDTPGALVALFQWVLEAERRSDPIGGRDLRAMLGLLELDDLTLAGAG